MVRGENKLQNDFASGLNQGVEDYPRLLSGPNVITGTLGGKEAHGRSDRET